MDDERKVFKPKRRKLFDLLLFTNGLLFFAFIFHTLPFHLLIAFCLSLNLLVLSGWFFVITPLIQVEISHNTLVGRTPSFSKKNISFRKIHHIKTNTPLEGMKRKLFKDIHSVDGEVIRLQRKFLGEGQVNTIMLAIEKYPFRQGNASAAETP